MAGNLPAAPSKPLGWPEKLWPARLTGFKELKKSRVAHVRHVLERFLEST